MSPKKKFANVQIPDRGGFSNPAESGQESEDNDEDGLENCGSNYASSYASSSSENILLDLARQLRAKAEVHPLLDAESVQATQERLMVAVDAERYVELQGHIKKMDSTREFLEDEGTLITGLRFTIRKDREDSSKAQRSSALFEAYLPLPNGGKMPLPKHSFKAKQGISIFEDLYYTRLEKTNEDSKKDGTSLMEDIGSLEGCSLFVPSGNAEDPQPDEDDSKRHPLLWGRADRASLPEGAKVKESKESLASVLKSLGLSKCFDGSIISIHKDHLLISSRYDKAADGVEEADGATFCIFGMLSDVTIRRQRSAIESLGSLFDEKNEDEARIRQLLISHNEPVISKLASQRVSWMSDSAQDELRVALKQDADLNTEQLQILEQATTNSLTLLQGPPGTGKSKALASAVKAFCRVFLRPGNSDAAGQAFGFQRPTLQPLIDWPPSGMGKWIDSLVTDPSEGVAPAAKGVTSAIKEWLILWHKTSDFSGKAFNNMTIRVMTNGIQDSLIDGFLMSDDQAKEAAELCVPILIRLRNDLDVCIASRSSTASGAIMEKEMRISVAADSNVAVDKVLSYLDSDPDFLALGYQIIRLGPEGSIDGGLVKKYSLEFLRGRHLLFESHRKMSAMMGGGGTWSEDVAKEVEESINQFREDMLKEAKNNHLSSPLRRQFDEMSEVVSSVSKKILSYVHRWLSPDEAKFQAKWDRKLANLTRDIKRVITFDIVARAQVVLGTNTSFGELRGWNERLKLTNSIVFLDEAGQTTEPSALIPLTLGAEWVMLAGDLKQLRPTILSSLAKKCLGYYGQGGGSLYGRFYSMQLVERTLVVQYRMHPSIREFPSDMFYRDKNGVGILKEDPVKPPANSRVPFPRDKDGRDMRWWPFQQPGSFHKEDFPIAFFDIAGTDKCNASQSHYNLDEASVALRLLLLFGTDPTVKSIVIISPYSAQSQLLNEALFVKGSNDMNQMRRQGTFHVEHIGSYTVDGFQGQEADVVIISTVRSNMGGRSLGHVSDARRLNVAITRAKRALIVVGNGPSLKAVRKDCIDKGVGDVRNYWPEWLDWVSQHGAYVNQADVEPKYLQQRVVLPRSMVLTDKDSTDLEFISNAVATVDFIKQKEKGKRKAAQKSRPTTKQ